MGAARSAANVSVNDTVSPVHSRDRGENSVVAFSAVRRHVFKRDQVSDVRFQRCPVSNQRCKSGGKILQVDFGLQCTGQKIVFRYLYQDGKVVSVKRLISKQIRRLTPGIRWMVSSGILASMQPVQIRYICGPGLMDTLPPASKIGIPVAASAKSKGVQM